MMISSNDIALLGRGLDDDVEIVARYFFQFWPDMVVEQESSEIRRYDASQDPLENFEQTFLYKDQATYEEIEKIGVTKELDNLMVSVTRDGTDVVLVVGFEWDAAPLIAHFYRTADEQADPVA